MLYGLPLPPVLPGAKAPEAAVPRQDLKAERVPVAAHIDPSIRQLAEAKQALGDAAAPRGAVEGLALQARVELLGGAPSGRLPEYSVTN
ncbi:MAG TPA: hypothetical protein VES73_10235 [Lamprocystis sp. (in: g-proteobacteria)]|nr:hypothetical protein [Lamprocystis sp. (in: g-proteobacteria)]